MREVTSLYHRQLHSHSYCVDDERFLSFCHRVHVRVKLSNRRRCTNYEASSSVLHRYWISPKLKK